MCLISCGLVSPPSVRLAVHRCGLHGWTCRGPCCLLAPPCVQLEVAVVEDNPLVAGMSGTEAAGCPAVEVKWFGKLSLASVTLEGEEKVACL